MDTRFYIPREMSMRLTLLGFTWASVRDWAQYMTQERMLKPHRNPVDKDYMLEEDNSWFQMKRLRKEFEECDRNNKLLPRIFRYASISVITWDQAETWLHETYGVDFIKRPEAGAEKRYLCDVVIPGMGHQQLESKETMRAAQEAALWFVIDNVKELPTIPAPTEEELEAKRLKEVAERAQEKEAAIAMLPSGFVLIDDPNFAYRDYISTRYDYKIGSYVGIPKVTVHKAEDVILEEN